MARLSPATSACLGLGYTAPFALSSLLLVGMPWWCIPGNFDQWNDAAIAGDSAEIGDQLRDTGPSGAIEAIRVHTAEIGGASGVYLLADSRLKPFAAIFLPGPVRRRKKPAGTGFGSRTAAGGTAFVCFAVRCPEG
jgi:hypothetical protein